jgi:hypothetical protein
MIIITFNENASTPAERHISAELRHVLNCVQRQKLGSVYIFTAVRDIKHNFHPHLSSSFMVERP